MAWWSHELKLNVEVEGQQHIPTEGPILFYGNHPTGIGDGIAIYDALRAAGLDHELAFVMNAQGLEGTPAIADVAVHVGVEKGVRTNNNGKCGVVCNKFRLKRRWCSFPVVNQPA